MQACARVRRRGLIQLIASVVALGSFARVASADSSDVVLLPTVVASPTAESEELVRPEPSDDSAVARWARQLDATLHEAAQDLGLSLDVGGGIDASARSLGEDALVERARGTWVISPRLEVVGRRLRVRLVGVAPDSKVLLVRTAELEPRDASIRAMVMLRDLVSAGRGSTTPSPTPGADEPSPAPAYTTPARSQGRAVLAVNTAAFGGYVGFSLQRASGSSDERLTYPLIALGAGIGLGGSMIVADEWDVGLGDAWYLSAGAWWPTLSGMLLAEGYGVEPASDRYMYGLLGASVGMSLATASLSLRGMGEGGAMLTHSGGAFGLLLGGLTEFAVDGSLEGTPTKGAGFGAGTGVLAMGALATQFRVPSSRVLLIDLGAVLGGLTGAAASSPLVFGEDRSASKDRVFLASTGAGILAGGVVAYFVTAPSVERSATAEASARWLPWAGVVGSPVSTGHAPGYGAGVQGLW